MAWVNLVLAFVALSACVDVCYTVEPIDPPVASGVFRSRVYTLHNTWANVLQAIRKCALGDGAVLASVTDDQELAFITNLIQQANVTNGYVWVGGFYQHQNFVWMDSNTPIATSSSVWAAGNPKKTAANNYRCTLLLKADSTATWRLNDWECSGATTANAYSVCVR